MEKINESNNDVLTNQERDKILHDLFTGKDFDSSFLYKGKGAELYEKISKDPSYPYIDLEINSLCTLDRNKKLKKIFDKIKFITDVGCGDGQKAVALLENRSFYWNGVTYIAEDYSREMLDIAEKNVKEKARGIQIGSSQKLNNGKHLSKHCPNNMYLFLGGTICNMSDEEIVEELKDMDNNGLIEGNYILLSYFTAPNTEEEIEELEKIYKSDTNKAFHENGIKMLGLSTTDFEYDAKYIKDNPSQKEGPFQGKVVGLIRAKNDNVIHLSNGKEIEIKRGQEFTLHYSRRFTKDGINNLFKKSGCSVVYKKSEKGDSIVLLKKKPKKLGGLVKEYSDTIRNTLIIGAIASAGIIGTHAGQQIEKNKDKEKAYVEREANKTETSEGVFYVEETNELISALQLNDIKKEENRQIIIDLFNKYVSLNKNTTAQELVQGFRKEYGEILIQHFELRHSPYDFISKELIDETKIIDDEILLDNFRNSNFISVHRYEGPFKYNDSGRTYRIIKAYIFDKPVYGAIDGEHYVRGYKGNQFSTITINEIENKDGLDSKILENNNFGRIMMRITDQGMVAYPDRVRLDKEIKTVYVNGKIYYMKLGSTLSGKTIGLVSKSEEGPFTINEFNKMAEEFSKSRNI